MVAIDPRFKFLCNARQSSAKQWRTRASTAALISSAGSVRAPAGHAEVIEDHSAVPVDRAIGKDEMGLTIDTEPTRDVLND